MQDSVLAYVTVQLPIVFEQSNSNVIDIRKTHEAVEGALRKLLSKKFKAMKLYFPKPFGRYLDDDTKVCHL